MKKINKMNELNVVNSKITADLIKPEITGHATSNFETTFPIPKVGEVKMKIDVTSTVTSSIAAQEKLDELAEKTEQYKEKFREKQSLEEWDKKVDNLFFLLRQKT